MSPKHRGCGLLTSRALPNLSTVCLELIVEFPTHSPPQLYFRSRNELPTQLDPNILTFVEIYRSGSAIRLVQRRIPSSELRCFYALLPPTSWKGRQLLCERNLVELNMC